MNGRKEKDNDREERILKDRQKIKDRVYRLNRVALGMIQVK